MRTTFIPFLMATLMVSLWSLPGQAREDDKALELGGAQPLGRLEGVLEQMKDALQ